VFRARVGRVSPFIPPDEDHAEGEEWLGRGTRPRVEQPEGHVDPPEAILLVRDVHPTQMAHEEVVLERTNRCINDTTRHIADQRACMAMLRRTGPWNGRNVLALVEATCAHD
jgi:hypothetical protein